MSSRKRIVVPLTEFNQEIEEFEEYDVASCLLEKEEEEELIEHFLELQIHENNSAAPVHDQEIVEIQDPEVLNEEKQSSAKDRKKQLKITSFFKLLPSNFSVIIKILSKILPIIGKFLDDSFP